MPLPKPAAQLIGATLFVALLASAIHFLSATSADASPALTKTYSNPAWGFMLKMPADFAVYPPNATPNRDETGAPIGQAIVLKNTAGAMVQIIVTQSDEASPDNTFTVADMEREAPYVDPSQAQSVQLATGVTGMTFTEGGPPPAPTSVDVLMFTYRGNLYVLTAPAKDRALFEAMMETWTFL